MKRRGIAFVLVFGIVAMFFVACDSGDREEEQNADTDAEPASLDETGGWIESATLEADRVMVFNGIPAEQGWGNDIIFQASEEIEEMHFFGIPALGGIPFIDIWSDEGGVALFNVADHYEPFTVQISAEEGVGVVIRARGGSQIVKYEHEGDYFEALREFATRMRGQGIAAQTAPGWAFDPIWETYGFEESWNISAVMDMLPLLNELGIGTITLDSGWYGVGTEDWVAYAGDFPINPDVIGTEQDLVDFIDTLHGEGFKVRLWWTPGVAEEDTQLYEDHPEWFYEVVTPSWGSADDTGDWYLDPTLPEVQEWNRSVVERFIGYGADGFKQDDVYEIDSDGAAFHRQYSALFRDIFTTATARNPDFVINTCNCGVVQNFFDFPGENQLITSDPVGPLQFRRRAKYLHALNLNGAAILGDHIELSQGDVGRDDLSNPAFYTRINDADFASTVALGMVLETKLTMEPGETYHKWFRLYREYGFYDMEWVNIPHLAWEPVEIYLVRDVDALFFSFFAEGDYSGSVELSHLEAGETYSVHDIVNEVELGWFTATSSVEQYNVDFTGSLVIRVSRE